MLKKRNLGWGSNIVYCVHLLRFPNLNEWIILSWISTNHGIYIRLGCPGWRIRVWAFCDPLSTKEVGLDCKTNLSSALLFAPRRSDWWMGSNQQQTDLPQETSPHHVYGNQHFSRDLLIVTEGEGEGDKKQLDSPSFSTKKISRLSTFHWPQYDLEACCQMAS